MLDIDSFVIGFVAGCAVCVLLALLMHVLCKGAPKNIHYNDDYDLQRFADE